MPLKVKLNEKINNVNTPPGLPLASSSSKKINPKNSDFFKKKPASLRELLRSDTLTVEVPVPHTCDKFENDC